MNMAWRDLQSTQEVLSKKIVKTPRGRKSQKFRKAQTALAPLSCEPVPLSLPLSELGSRSCRWPVNDAGPHEQHLFCGHPQRDTSTYCEHHHQRSKHRGPLPFYLRF